MTKTLHNQKYAIQEWSIDLKCYDKLPPTQNIEGTN